jgi:outer membrane lipopolysaccharide assembly protein LptE/RlpB
MRLRPLHLLVLAPALLGGCGYQTNGSFNPDANRGYEWKSLYREDIQTVAVPIFATRSFQRGAENDLTKAVIAQLELRSPYKVVPRDRAQTILEGEIEAIDVNTVSQDAQTLLPLEQELSMTVNFTWKDIRTGRIIVERRSFKQTAIYYSKFGEGRTQGTLSATEKLATAIVQQLEADW